jgi:hypothetical protein
MVPVNVIPLIALNTTKSDAWVMTDTLPMEAQLISDAPKFILYNFRREVVPPVMFITFVLAGHPSVIFWILRLPVVDVISELVAARPVENNALEYELVPRILPLPVNDNRLPAKSSLRVTNNV